MANMYDYMKIRFVKLGGSVLLVMLSFLCFYFPSKSTETTVNKMFHEMETTVTIEYDGIKLFWNYVGLFLMIMAVWSWRRELQINHLGIIGNNDIEPLDPQALPKEKITGSSSADKYIVDEKTVYTMDELQVFKRQELKNNIVMAIRDLPHGLVNTNILAGKFGYSTHTIELVLFELMKENILRRDSYPGSMKVNYSDSASIENRAIDDFMKQLKSEILTDNRYIMVKHRFAVDAIVKTALVNYVIEVKIMRTFSVERTDAAIKQLMTIEEHITLIPLKLVLIIATNTEHNRADFDQYLSMDNLIIYHFNYAV